MHTWTEYAKILTGLLTITNALGALPVFAGLTSDFPRPLRKRTANVTALTVGVVLVVSALVGEAVLHFFGIRVASFRTGGGILILLMGISMLHARQSGAAHVPEEAAEARDREAVGVVPLAIPLIAGPGAMSTMIVYAHQGSGWAYDAFLVGAGIAVALITLIVLRAAAPISRILGRTGINIITRLMGLLLTAIAIEFIAGGLAQLFPVLAAR